MLQKSQMFILYFHILHPSMHPSITTCLALRIVEPISAIVRQRRGTPWTSSSQGWHTETPVFAPIDNLEWTFHLTCMSLEYGRKPEYPMRTQKGLYLTLIYNAVAVLRNIKWGIMGISLTSETSKTGLCVHVGHSREHQNGCEACFNGSTCHPPSLPVLWP